MKHKLFVIAAGLLATAPAGAQSNPYPTQCPPGTITLGVPDSSRATQDACVKAIDLFRYIAPQLGTVVAGGNAILGSGGSLGGLGQISFGLRLNALRGDLPRLDQTTLAINGAQSAAFETKNQLIPLPAADLAIGVFGGIPLGLTNVGGFDVLVSASYLPEFDANQVSVKLPGGAFKVGYGARLGILKESFVVPGVSLSVLRRDLPTVDLSARAQNGDSVSVNGFDVRTRAWRLTASKSFLMFGLTLGGGRDHYEFDGTVTADVKVSPTARVKRTISDAGAGFNEMDRTSYFIDLSVNLPFFRLVGEIGQVSGGDISTFNTFGGAPDKSRTYGSIGIRLGW